MFLRMLAIGSLLAMAMMVGAQNPSAAGEWQGLLMSPVGDIALTITLQQSNGTWSGIADIPVQKVTGIVLKGIIVDKDTIGFTFTLPGDPTFRGAFAEGGQAATGQLKQGSETIPLKLARTTALLGVVDVSDDNVSLEEATGLP